MIDKYAEFEKSYKESVEKIKEYETNIDMSKYTKWLMTTDINPYSFLDDGYAGMTSSAEGMSCLLDTIHHALIDDGEISFIKLDRQPIIRFIHSSDFEGGKRDDFDFVKYEETQQMKLISKEVDCVVTFLDNFDEFIESIEEYETKQLKCCFINDTERLGIEQSLSHYESDPRFNKEWISEIED